MRIEYLIIIKQSDTFCNTKDAFINFLRVDSSITITKNVIQYRSSSEGTQALEVTFKLKTGEILSKNERYFHLELENHETGKEKEFILLVSTIKDIVQRINPNLTSINTLWDDISRQYSIQCYPLINEVENLMRKLISRFMLINVGMDWSKEAVHSELSQKMHDKQPEQDSYLDALYKTDFINLSDALFQPYRTLKVNELDRILAKAQKTSDLDVEKIERFSSKIKLGTIFF